MTDDDGIDGPHDAAWAAAEAEDRIDFAALTDPAPPEPDVYVERDPWLARRMLGFGASEALVLLVALGWASEDDLASYQRPRVNKIATKGLAPTARLWLEKAGLRRPLSAKAAAADIPVCGGNSMGFYNYDDNVFVSFDTPPPARPRSSSVRSA